MSQQKSQAPRQPQTRTRQTKPVSALELFSLTERIKKAQNNVIIPTDDGSVKLSVGENADLQIEVIDKDGHTAEVLIPLKNTPVLTEFLTTMYPRQRTRKPANGGELIAEQ